MFVGYSYHQCQYVLGCSIRHCLEIINIHIFILFRLVYAYKNMVSKIISMYGNIINGPNNFMKTLIIK